MKVLLIDPPFQRFMGYYRFYYPLGLAMIASVLHQQGHIVNIFDAEHSPNADSLSWGEATALCDSYNDALKDDAQPVWSEIRNYVKQFRPRVVGISVLSVKVASAYKIARICKEIDPGIIIVVGADHPTVFPSVALEIGDIDIVVRGEGESTIVELAQLLEKEGMDGALDRIDGISYKYKGQITHNRDRTLIPDLDNLPFPRIESLVQFKTYRPVDFGAIMTSRGCPFRCTFCGVHNVWSRKVRYRSIQNVTDEINLLKDTYRTEYFSFRDAVFTNQKERIMRFCDDLISRQLSIRWECLARADFIDSELLQKMKKAGCVTIRIGVESGDKMILQSMKKKIDLQRITQAADLLNRMQFYWSAYFMFGTPEETRNSIQTTLDYIRLIDPPFITLSRFAPIPGSELYDELAKKGLVSSHIDWSMENNQRLASHYLLKMKPSEFEKEMKKVISYVDEHNQRKSRELGITDARLL